MLKRELRVNLKSFIIWFIILIAIFLFVFLMYPSIINSSNINMMDEMMKMFPEEVLKALNMDISSIDTAFGWLKSEGFVFIILLTGIYSSILGSNILLKEESEGTISYLHSLPIKRKNILFGKIVCSLIYIIIMVLGIGIFNYICLEISGDFDQEFERNLYRFQAKAYKPQAVSFYLNQMRDKYHTPNADLYIFC